MDFYTINLCLIFLSFIISLISQIYINVTYSKYKKISNNKCLTGFDVAREILDKNNLNDIKILETRGNLTDYYDPSRKVLKLSTDIYNNTTIAACAVAAHECGHAIQDKDNYKPMKLRSSLVPIVNFCSKLGYLAIIIGIFSGIFNIAFIGIILLISMLIFQLITLPVEFNASHRALKELTQLNLLEEREHDQAKTMLNAAAFTYVAALLTTILEIFRLFLMATSNDRN